MMPAYLEHTVTKQIKEAKVSDWNFMVLFLGPIAPLVRGDWKWTILFCLGPIGILLCLIGVNKYNFWYIKDLLKKGYKIKSLPPTMTPEQLSKKVGFDVSDYFVRS